MSEYIVKAMNDLHTNVSFGGGGGGGGGRSTQSRTTTTAACVATVGAGLSLAGNVRSGNVLGASGSATSMAAAAAVCVSGLRVGPTDTSGESRYFGI